VARDHAGYFAPIDPARIALHSIHTGVKSDPHAEYARIRAPSFTHRQRSLSRWIDTVQTLAPDAILYPALGMDDVTANLAALRLAALQLATWGHPETAGFPTGGHRKASGRARADAVRRSRACPRLDGQLGDADAMIHVLAIITTHPGQREAVLAAFRANVPAVHAEAGCIEYGPAIDTPDAGRIQTPVGPDSFVVIEKWESMDHLRAHAVAPHMAAYAAKVKDMLAGRVIHVLSPA